MGVKTLPKCPSHTEGARESQGVFCHPDSRGPGMPTLFHRLLSHLFLPSLSCSQSQEPGALTGQLLVGFHQGKTSAGGQRGEEWAGWSAGQLEQPAWGTWWKALTSSTGHTLCCKCCHQGQFQASVASCVALHAESGRGVWEDRCPQTRGCR